jgi:putative oxidoreductase
MKLPHLIARFAIYLLSLVMIVFGLLHFMHPRDLVNYVPQFLPGGIIWVYFVGAAFIIVAIAFITNTMVKAAGYLLAGLLIIFILSIHLPNYLNAGDKEMKQMALISLLKDTAIACFALYIGAGAHHQKLHMEESD